MGWCIWVKAGGASQPSSMQPPCSMVALMRWALEWKRLCSAEVEDFGLAAEDGGDDPGFAGDPAGEGGGDVLAGVEVGCLDPAERVS